MGRWRKTSVCERTPEWISLELDGELSEFERALLERHLQSCASCAAARFEIRGFTRIIREAPIIPLRSGVNVAPPRSTRRTVARRGGAAVLAAASLAAAGAYVLPRHPSAFASSAYAFASQRERIRYLHVEQVRIEPLRSHGPELPPLSPALAVRVLA